MTGGKARVLAAIATWSLLFLASPGVLGRDGSALLAGLALVPWARWCSRPGPKAFLMEWLAASIGSAAVCAWMWYVWPGTLLFIGLVPGLYWAGAGWLLRLLARRFPLALAAPAAWIGFEVLQHTILPPFAFGWMRLGTHLHAADWLAGSARVWGTGGLSWVLAAVAGGAADLWAQRRAGLALGIAPTVLAAALALLTAPPPATAGPRVMLVQPAFEQHRKMNPPDFRELFEESRALTVQGLLDAKRAGEPPVDLVAWGETMLPYPLAEPGLAEAWDRGARSVPWGRIQLTRAGIESMDAFERDWIQGRILGREGLLPPGTSFLSGVEHYALDGSDIRRSNAVLLWDAEGRRAGIAGKVHLVPGGEQICGLERVGWVRDLIQSVAGYVPDLVPFDRAKVLELRARDGRAFEFGISVCFDNAYDDSYTGPLREGGLDFHLVVSNEAWYRKSFEYDQMVAFSRLLAIETARSFVRVTNAGVTLVLDASGREVARLSRMGEDRMVPGTLCATVPVPADRTSRTPYVRFETAWLALWLLLPVALALAARRPVTAVPPGARGRA